MKSFNKLYPNILSRAAYYTDTKDLPFSFIDMYVLFSDFDQGQCDSVCECHLVLQGASHLHLHLHLHLVLQGASHLHLLGCCLFLQHIYIVEKSNLGTFL